MSIDVLFAGVAVADLDAGLAWYERVWGRPADIVPNDDEAMWKIVDAGWLYVIRDATRAGNALVTVAVADLDETVAELAGRGIAGGPIETIGTAGRKAKVDDPEGNCLAFIEVTPTG